MKRLFLVFVLLTVVFLFSSNLYAVDSTFAWDPVPGATGYKIYSSQDGGVTWGTPIDVGNVTTKILTGQPEDKLMLYKVSAYNTSGETITHWMGAWYDHRKKPPESTKGLGIK